jgi:hypothetical protein
VAQTTVTHVALVNHSTVIDDTDVTLLADALTQQVEHLAQAGYDIYADVLHYAPGHEPLDAWRLYIVDDTDQADALHPDRATRRLHVRPHRDRRRPVLDRHVVA